MLTKAQAKNSFYGFIIGDAIGVPYEFESREFLKKYPAKGFVGYRVHNQQKGTWSDDTSLLLASIEAKNDQDKLKENIKNWYYKKRYTQNDEIFDIGFSTKQSIIKNFEVEEDINSNGNGAIVRILPLFYYIIQNNISTEIAKELIKTHVYVTHKHKINLQVNLEFFNVVYSLLKIGGIKRNLFFQLDKELTRIWQDDFHKLSESSIKSSGYVVDTLEASIWSYMNSGNFKKAVLKSINLGGDTDSIGAITGALSGLFFSIPKDWLNTIYNIKIAEDIINNF